MFHNWIKRLFQTKNSSFSKEQPRPRRATGYQFRLEELEDRLTPTSWVNVGSLGTATYEATAALLSNGDVIEGCFNVIPDFRMIACDPLELVQERHGQNQVKILGLIPPEVQPAPSVLIVSIREQRLIRIDNRYGLQ